MQTRTLNADDRPALEALLMHEPVYNLYHLGALAEQGLALPEQGRAWAIGVYRGDDLAGALVGLHGTGGVYFPAGDGPTLDALAEAVLDRAVSGSLNLLSGHSSQLDPLLQALRYGVLAQPDRCYFRMLSSEDLSLPGPVAGFSQPRLATEHDMEKLIDFYEIGFYSLARLPTRDAWRTRLSEQLAFRTLFLIEDEQNRVASAAQSSAEAGGAAMLGGVATLREYRGKGLSALCVGALCQHLFRATATTIALFYLKDNIAAGRVYDKLGFQPAGEWLLLPVGGVM